MALKTYYVTMPLAGSATMPIEAESEQDAINKFHEQALKVDFENGQDRSKNGVDMEWSFYEKISQGNFFFAPVNEASAELGFGEDDDDDVQEED